MSSWSATNRSTTADGTISTPIWTIPHIQGNGKTIASGIDSYVIWNDFPNGPQSFVGGSNVYNYSIGAYQLSLFGYDQGVAIPASSLPNYIRSENSRMRATELRCYSNAVNGDSGGDRIVAFSQQVVFSSPNGSTTGNRSYIPLGFDLANSNWPDTYEVPVGGTINNPLQIGDSGTQWGFSGVIGNTGVDPFFSTKIGLQDQFSYSNYNYWLAVEIASAAVTKTYQFRFEYDYVYY